MSRRKAPYQKKPFESSGAASDTSANIYASMLLSPAWRDLTAQQQRLYLYCKAQYYGEKRKPVEGDATTFTFNKSKWCALYGLYDDGNGRGFYRDLSALIMHGFISCVECGAITRTKSIYRFSPMWQKWGTPEFYVGPADCTVGMIRKARSKKG